MVQMPKTSLEDRLTAVLDDLREVLYGLKLFASSGQVLDNESLHKPSINPQILVSNLQYHSPDKSTKLKPHFLQRTIVKLVVVTVIDSLFTVFKLYFFRYHVIVPYINSFTEAY